MRPRLLIVFGLAAGATLTTPLTAGTGNPLPAWGYELAMFLLAAREALAGAAPPRTGWAAAVAMVAIPAWGFGQIALGATISSYATWNASLAYAGLAGSALMVANASERNRIAALHSFVWFTTLVALATLLARCSHTAGGSNNWGPFPNRNHFAAFLELALPVAIWLSEKPIYLGAAAGLVAAGLATASRAGAALLILEAIVAGVLMWRLRMGTFVRFALLTAALTAILGAGELARRFRQPDPFEYRREIAGSALAMIADHRWFGSGLGTFQTVYPAYAQFDSGMIVDHAHNDWLEWAAEGGVPFALLWLSLAFMVAGPAIRSVWGIGVVAVFLHAVVDYPFARLGVSAWTFFLMGALFAEKSRHRRPLTARDEAKKALQFTTARATGVTASALLFLPGIFWANPVSCAPLEGAAAVIGTVSTPGSARVDHSTIQGNATLFEGATIETDGSAATIELRRGAHVSLAAFSRARVFAERVVLEKGDAEFGQRESKRFRLEVRELITIRPEGHATSGRISAARASVIVAASSGSLDALNQHGTLIATLAPGRVLEFNPQPAGTQSHVAGCLTQRSGHFLLTDETTNVVVEVAGAGLQKERDNRVEITGSPDPTALPVPEATEYVRVANLKRISKGCGKSRRSAAAAGSGGQMAAKSGSPGESLDKPADGAAEPAAEGAAVEAGGEAPTGNGISGKTIAIVGGVAVAAVLGGLAAAGKLQHHPNSQPPISN
jgi:O-antigen ligase